MLIHRVGPKLVLTLALVVLVSTASMGFLSYLISERILSHRVRTVDMNNLIEVKVKSIQEVLKGAVKVSRMLANNYTLNQWFVNQEKNKKQKLALTDTLNFIANDLGYPIVFAVNGKTNHYWTQKSSQPEVLSPTKKENHWFYQTLTHPPGTVLIDLDTSVILKGTYIFINVLMGKDNKSYGVAGVGFPVEELISQFTQNNFGKHGKVWLVSQQGLIQIDEHKKNLGLNINQFLPKNVAEQLLNTHESIKIISYQDRERGNMLFGASPVEGTSWIAIIGVAESQWLNTTLQPIQRGIFYSGTAAVIFISILFSIISYFLVKVLGRLATAIVALGRREFNHNLEGQDLKRRDEFGDIARGYEQSRHNLSEAYEENERILHGLEDTVKARTQEIQHINEVACTINSTLKFEDILLALLEKLQSIFSFNQIGVFLLDANQSYLSISHYSGEGITEKKLLKMKQLTFAISPDNSFSKTVLNEQVTYVDNVNGEYVSTFSSEEKALYALNPIKSFICIPLQVQGKFIGTLVFAHTNKTMALDDGLIEKISRYVVQIANAIQNAQLFHDLKTTKLQLLETEKIASMTKAFERFVPKQFLTRLSKNGVEDVEVGMVECSFQSILFSDIRNFTSLSESMPPQELLRFLNSYLARMNEVIMRNNGFIDKFIGDAIMGIFDEQSDNHFNEAQLAVKTAIEMQQALDTYNQHRANSGYMPVSIGIGIHSGPVVIGTVGSEERLQTTVLGDTVNAAARLEGLTKFYNASIVISAQTHQFIKTDPKFYWRELDYIQVKGKEEAMHIYEVFNADPKPIFELKRKIRLRYQAAIKHYRSQQWQQAKALFEECLSIFPDDKVSQLYLQRTLECIQNPPDEHWTGIYTATFK